MTYEHKERIGDRDIWQGRDAEGRVCYVTSKRRGGISVEPTGVQVGYSLQRARNIARYYNRLNEEEGKLT